MYDICLPTLLALLVGWDVSGVTSVSYAMRVEILCMYVVVQVPQPWYRSRPKSAAKASTVLCEALGTTAASSSAVLREAPGHHRRQQQRGTARGPRPPPPPAAL